MGAFLKYLPFILQAIIAVQAAVPTLKGASKKQIVLGLVTLGTGLAGEVPNANVQGIGALIDGSVDILKKAGVFGQDQVPVVPLVPPLLPVPVTAA